MLSILASDNLDNIQLNSFPSGCISAIKCVKYLFLFNSQSSLLFLRKIIRTVILNFLNMPLSYGLHVFLQLLNTFHEVNDKENTAILLTTTDIRRLLYSPSSFVRRTLSTTILRCYAQTATIAFQFRSLLSSPHFSLVGFYLVLRFSISPTARHVF